MKKYLFLTLACLVLAAAQALVAQDDTPDNSRYILTPKAPDTPRINGPRVYGARPGADFLFRIPTTGVRPMTWSAEGLPRGLKLDRNTGIIKGKVGWGPKTHWTDLTPDEQFTHITLWSILASPLLIGCDMAEMDDFTLSLLCNNEVIDVNQDPLGVQGVRQEGDGSHAIYVKPLEDGSLAVALFNLSESPKKIGFTPAALGMIADQTLHDLWRQRDLGTVARKERWETEVAPHGTVFLRLSPGNTDEKLHGFFR